MSISNKRTDTSRVDMCLDEGQKLYPLLLTAQGNTPEEEYKQIRHAYSEILENITCSLPILTMVV